MTPPCGSARNAAMRAQMRYKAREVRAVAPGGIDMWWLKYIPVYWQYKMLALGEWLLERWPWLRALA